MTKEENKPNYIVLDATKGNMYVNIYGKDDRYKLTEYIFDKPVEEVIKDKNIFIFDSSYIIPVDYYLYRLKEPDCEYELIGMTGNDIGRTFFHLLKKKTNTNNNIE